MSLNIIVRGGTKSGRSAPGRSRPRSWYRGTSVQNVREAVDEAVAEGCSQNEIEFRMRRVTSGVPASKYPEAVAEGHRRMHEKLNALPPGVEMSFTQKAAIADPVPFRPKRVRKKK